MAQFKPLLALLCFVILVPATGLANDRRVRNTTPPPYTPRNDVDFIEALVPHHEGAIQMAQIEVQKGTRAEVKTMAQQMIDQQAQEIAVMTSEYQAITGRSRVPSPPRDNHMRADMLVIQAASGAAVDEAFLEHMIPHHANAISLAHRALPFLRRQALKDLATNTENGQAAEIGEMQEMKANP